MQMGLNPSNVATFPFHLRLQSPWRHRFETVLADTEEARGISFRLRYQIFCEETGFEDPRAFPNNQEQDIFDSASTPFLVWDYLTEQWAGTMRLVHARRAALPSETILWPSPLAGIAEHRAKSVEFSRLCIPQSFRRVHSATYFASTQPDADSDDGTSVAHFKQEDNEILLRVLLAFLAWAHEHEVEYSYFLINAALARILGRLHMPLTVAGDTVEHRGRRTPYLTHIDTAYRVMREKLPQLRRIEARGRTYVRYSAFRVARQTRPERKKSVSKLGPALASKIA